MKISPALLESPLFVDISCSELDLLLKCLKVMKRSYCKDEYVFVTGGKTGMVGVVISGGVRVMHEGYRGYRTILEQVGPGELFGEASACMEYNEFPVSVAASESSEILLVNYRRLVTTCPAACSFHPKMIMNMMQILATKNIRLTRKLEHLSKRTMREKLLSFLSAQSGLTQDESIDIPFSRQELADYLCVDRSALSRELSIMQNEGVIVCEKRKFRLVQKDHGRC